MARTMFRLPGMLLEDQTGLSYSEVTDWEKRVNETDENWDWFTGEKLNEEDKTFPGKDGQRPMKWPLKINPFSTASRLHSFALIGEIPDTSASPMRTIIEPKKQDDAAKARARELQDLIEAVEYQNNMRAAFVDMALSIQPLGGIVIKVGWEGGAHPARPLGIRLEHFDPRAFFCRWQSTDYWNLTEAWIKKEITQAEAASYGVKVATQLAEYIEHWTLETYEISVDGTTARDSKNNPLSGRHGFGFVPFVYIPHERANGFWGRSLIPEVIGLVKELNSRMADVGDAMHLGVNSIVTGRNIKPGHPQLKTLPGSSQPYLDLGRAISQGDPQPEMTRIDAPTLPAGASDFNATLENQVRTYLLTPPVAYGVQEASQRSGESQSQRMWPLLSHTRQERTNWTTGKNKVSWMILSILALKGKGVEKGEASLTMRQAWSEMVPIDRSKLLDEMIRRKQEGSISLELMMERFQDVPDIQDEIKKVWADIERMAEIESRIQKLQLDAQTAMQEKQLAAQEKSKADTATQPPGGKPNAPK